MKSLSVSMYKMYMLPQNDFEMNEGKITSAKFNK